MKSVINKDVTLESISSLLQSLKSIKNCYSIDTEILLKSSKYDLSASGSLFLPYGHGKLNRNLAVFCADEQVSSISQSADVVVGTSGINSFIKNQQWKHINCCAAIHGIGWNSSVIKKLSYRLANKKMMPSAKGLNLLNLDDNIDRMLHSVKHNLVSWRLNKDSYIRLSIGRASMNPVQIMEHLSVIIDSIQNTMLSSSILSVRLTSTQLKGKPFEVSFNNK